MTTSIDERADPRSRRVAIAALVAGAALLGITLNVEQGSAAFYAAGLALAGIWITAYALTRSRTRPVRNWTADAVSGVIIGGVMFGVFVAGAWALARFDAIGNAVDELLDTADSSATGWVLVLAGINAVAEELFFRGTLIDAVKRRFAFAAGLIPYILTTVPSRNVALITAAVVMGTVLTALRVRTGTLTAPVATHLTWSALMIVLFPR